MSGPNARDHVRERGLEILVSTEYLPAFSTPAGTAAFGVLCEMVGKCLQHVAMGRFAEALMLAARIGQPIIDAVKDPKQREPLEQTYKVFLATLESLQGSGSTTIH